MLKYALQVRAKEDAGFLCTLLVRAERDFQVVRIPSRIGLIEIRFEAEANDPLAEILCGDPGVRSWTSVEPAGAGVVHSYMVKE